MGSYRKNKILRKADLVCLVAGEIFVRSTEEHFPLLLGGEVQRYLDNDLRLGL